MSCRRHPHRRSRRPELPGPARRGWPTELVALSCGRERGSVAVSPKRLEPVGEVVPDGGGGGMVGAEGGPDDTRCGGGAAAAAHRAWSPGRVSGPEVRLSGMGHSPRGPATGTAGRPEPSDAYCVAPTDTPA